MLSEDLSFEEWFDAFTAETHRLNYSGPIDKYSFEFDYDTGVIPEAAAASFVEEMKESCTSCGKKFLHGDGTGTDADDNHFCKECWEELAPVITETE